MASPTSDRYAGLAESTDDLSVSSARILLLDRGVYRSQRRPVPTAPHRQRRLQKPHPSLHPKPPGSPSFPPRPVSLPLVAERPVSGRPRLEQHCAEGTSSSARPRTLGSGFVLKTESSRPRLRSSGLAAVATRDGKLVKPMGPGEPRPLTALPLSDNDEDDEALGGWTKRWEKIRGFWKR